jgi:hypothetical protein
MTLLGTRYELDVLGVTHESPITHVVVVVLDDLEGLVLEVQGAPF